MIRRPDEVLPHRLGPADARQKKERSGGFLTAELERRFPNRRTPV